MRKEVKRWDELKALAEAAYERAPFPDMTNLDNHNRKFMAAANSAVVLELIAELDALERDAARFRWLNNPANFHAAVSQQLWLLHGSQEFGERIDRAIGKGEQP